MVAREDDDRLVGEAESAHAVNGFNPGRAAAAALRVEPVSHVGKLPK